MVAIYSVMSCVILMNMVGSAGVEAAAVTDVDAAADALCWVLFLLVGAFLGLV